jgi:zeaxanthin glucosyltransferase
MSRFLFVSLPLNGHAYPAAAVATALRERGHEVAWVGPETFLRPVIGPDTTVYPTGLRPYRGQRDLGARSIKSVWEGFVVPLARFMLPAVDRAVTAYRPDVLVTDQHAFAGALAAHRHRLPWATLAPGAMELTRPFEGRPKMEAWVRAKLAALWTMARLPGEPDIDLRFSPHLVLALTTPALTGARAFPDHFALIGPAIGDRKADLDFPWPSLTAGRRRVLVSMGTLAQDVSAEFYARTVQALAPLADRVQGIVVAPREAVPDPEPTSPAHAKQIVVAPRVPLLELLPQLDAVICHAGQNTVCEALAYGVPLVMAPIRHDQPIIANQVVRAGAGIRVRFHRVSPDQLRDAVTAVLDDPAYRSAAQRVRDSFTAAGGAPAAAGHLGALVP